MVDDLWWMNGFVLKKPRKINASQALILVTSHMAAALIPGLRQLLY